MPGDQSQSCTDNFAEITAHVFEVRGGKVFVGGEEATKQMRDALRDEARYIAPSRLWEIFNATIKHEAADLALKQSKNWDQVQFAKALHHWAHVFENAIYTLAKD